jgi:hypothetical protein
MSPPLARFQSLAALNCCLIMAELALKFLNWGDPRLN